MSRPNASSLNTSRSASISPILASRWACALSNSGLSGLTVIRASNQCLLSTSSPRSIAINSNASRTFALPGEDAYAMPKQVSAQSYRRRLIAACPSLCAETGLRPRLLTSIWCSSKISMSLIIMFELVWLSIPVAPTSLSTDRGDTSVSSADNAALNCCASSIDSPICPICSRWAIVL